MRIAWNAQGGSCNMVGLSHRMGRPNSGLKRHIQAHSHSAKKTPISIRYRPGVKRSYICIYRQGWVGEKMQWFWRRFRRRQIDWRAIAVQGAVYMHSSWNAVSPFSRHGHARALDPYTESMPRIHAWNHAWNHWNHWNEQCDYAIYELTNPQSYCGEQGSGALDIGPCLVYQIRDYKEFISST